MTDKLTLLTWHPASTPPTHDDPVLVAWDEYTAVIPWRATSEALAWASLPAVPIVGLPLTWRTTGYGAWQIGDWSKRRHMELWQNATADGWVVVIGDDEMTINGDVSEAEAKADAVNALRAKLAERIAADISAYNALPLDEEETP